MQFFHELGSLVEQSWRDEDYCEEVFPELAEQAMTKLIPYGQVDPWEIIRWVNTTTQLPEQQDVAGRFGNPPITLFNGPRFYIDVYYWLDGSTSIHQHAFCGAFHVLLGSSLHSKYSFDEKQKINAHFSVGRIRLNSVELLKEGDTRQILPGKGYIHSLFHLDRPSVSVTIRSSSTPDASPQYDYHKPYLARNAFYESPVTIKRVQCAELLLSMKHPKADEFIAELLSRADFQTTFAIIRVTRNHLTNDVVERTFGVARGQERFDALLDIARRRHGDLVDVILPVIDELQRQQNIYLRRGQITSNEHRFFLALLLNVPDRKLVLDLVKRRFPGNDPVDTVINWVEELAATRPLGGAEKNVLGIDDLDDDYLFVFQCMLEGLSSDEIKEAASREFPAEELRRLESRVEELYHSIRQSLLFKSLFFDSSGVAEQGVMVGAGRETT